MKKKIGDLTLPANDYQYNEGSSKKRLIKIENLEKLKCVLLQELPPGLKLDSLDFSEHMAFIKDSIVIRVKLSMLGKSLRPVKFKWPLTWWDHFKEKYFSEHLKKKYPVKYKRVEIIPRLIYPNMKGKIPEELASVNLEVKYKS